MASILALRSSGAQTVGNAQYLKVLFDQTDDINYGVMNLSTSVVASGTRITNTSAGVVQINVAYQVMFSEISGTSGQNTRITYISLNDASPPPPSGGYTNIYGLVSLQGDLYGTTCQGTCILTLQPNDFIEIYAYQNSGSSLNIGGTNGNIKYTNRIQITELYIDPTGYTGATGVTGSTGMTGATGYTGSLGPFGNVLRVDQVYGNDTTANASPYSQPFLTISNALNKAQSGQCVYVLPGAYNETLTLPSNVSVRGINLQAVTIQQLGVTNNTTLITMCTNTRLEDVTLTLSSSSNVNLTNVYFPDGTTINAKLRTLVINTTSTATGANNIYGILSNGSSSNTVSSFNAIQRSTINTTSAGSGVNRAIMNSGSNYFSVRDATIFCTGTGSNLVGVETSNTTGYTSVKTSTVSGTTYDIVRTAGTLLLNSTDLQNGTSNGLGFSVNTQPSQLFFTLNSRINFGGAGSEASTTMGTYYVKPGSDISNFAGTKIGIPFIQKVIVFGGLLSASRSITGSQVVTATMYKSTSSSGAGTSFVSMVLNSSTQIASFTGISTTFNTLTDFLQVQIVVSGDNLTAGTDISVGLSLY